MSRAIKLIIAVVTLTFMVPGTVAQARGPSPASDCPAINLTRLHAPSEVRSGLPESQLVSDFLGENGLSKHGYRPERLTGVQEGDQVRYATRWVKATGPDTKVAYRLTGDEFHADYLANRGAFRPIDVSGYNTPDGVRFNVIWERNTAGVLWFVHRDTTVDGLNNLVNQHKQDGFAPVRIEGYRGPGGELRFISTWIQAPRCEWQLHAALNIAAWDATSVDYVVAGYRQQHVDATRWQNEMWFHGIWWRQPGPAWQVRPDRDWYRYQQVANNVWCNGFELTNFYTADNGSGVRYGGIWTFDALPDIDDDSPLADQVAEEVKCAPGRGGTAIFNLDSGEQTLVLPDQIFGTSSTIKAAILYVLLDKLEAQGIDPDSATLHLPEQLGSNNGPGGDDDDDGPLTAGASYKIDYLARIMIDYSNNWATNRLIQYIAEISREDDANQVMDPINDALESLGMHNTRMNRYLTGDGSPSIHGSDDANGGGADYALGYDNVTTPREYAYFLQLMHVNPGLLAPAMHDRFWNLLALNGNKHAGALAEGIPDWESAIDQFTKGGSNKWGWVVNEDTNTWTSTASKGDFAHRPQLGSHVQRSEAGRIVFDNDQTVVYATFFNDAENVPSYQPFDYALDCIQVDVVRAYSGTTTGTVLSQCK